MTFTRWLASIPVIVALATIYGLCQLGFWQLNRAEEKQALIERHAHRSQQPAADLTTLLARVPDIADYPLQIEGEFRNEQNLLLDNRILNGKPGFNVITAFNSDNMIILVDRGWLPATGSRDKLPAIPRANNTKLSGTAYIPNPNIFTLKEEFYAKPQWPLLVQKIELAKIAPLFDKPLAPFLLRATPDETSALKRDVPVQMLDPERNYGYAFQWFAMASAVFFITLLLLLKQLKHHFQKPTKLLEQ